MPLHKNSFKNSRRKPYNGELRSLTKIPDNNNKVRKMAASRTVQIGPETSSNRATGLQLELYWH